MLNLMVGPGFQENWILHQCTEFYFAGKTGQSLH